METENRTMERVITTVMTVGELLFMWLRMTYEIILALVAKCLPANEKSVKGEVVLITGAGHGIGHELALQYAALGATVVCWDINAETNQNTVTEIKKLGYPKAHAYQCDVCDRQQILEVAKTVEREVGPVTVLVNNAGIMPIKTLMDHSDQDIRKIFDINVFAHFWLLEACLPNMLAKNRGHVVGISSVAGLCGLTYIVPYCASKYAVRGLMESLSEELRETVPNSQIKFTTICPYMVDTGLCKTPRIRFPAMMALLSPKEVAAAIITAMRRNVRDTTIPGYMLPLNYYLRLFPDKVAMFIKDFLDSGLQLESDAKKKL